MKFPVALGEILGEIPVSGWGSPYRKDLLGAPAPYAVLQEPVLPKPPPEQLCAGQRHQDMFAFNQEHPGIWVYRNLTALHRQKQAP